MKSATIGPFAAVETRERCAPGSLVLAAAIVLGGCHSVGPQTVEGDRVDYSTAITESWKQQTLLNVVKLRYADPPVFVDVGQIVAGYSLETAVNVAAADQNSPLGGGSTFSLGGSGRFTDRPTITYVPLTGSAFINGLITPIPPVSLFSAIQAGWPADAIVRLGISVINGISNEQFTGGGYAPADPGFSRIIELMRELQLSGGLAIRIERATEGGAATLFVLRNENIAPATAELARELRRLLQLDAERSDFSLVYGRTASSGGEIAVQSRSLLNILQLMSSQAAVPAEHVLQGRASAMPDNADRVSLPGFKILSSQERPEMVYVAQRYRDTWFYVDDTDLQSKRVFAFIMMLFTLADSSPERAAPVITIPVQ
jgi:hypothetical protein